MAVAGGRPNTASKGIIIPTWYAPAGVNRGQIGSAGGTYATHLPKGKSKMKRSLKMRFRDWLFADDDISNSLCVDKADVESVPNCISQENTIKFNVTPARGGSVLEAHSYDSKTDNRISCIYVIPENDDIATAIGQIVSLELMKR